MPSNDSPDTRATETFWFLVVAYVLHSVNLLSESLETRLDSLQAVTYPDWKKQIKKTLGVGPQFIRSVYALCSEHKSRMQSLGFVLRGLGCPHPQSRLVEVLGLEFVQSDQ